MRLPANSNRHIRRLRRIPIQSKHCGSQRDGKGASWLSIRGLAVWLLAKAWDHPRSRCFFRVSQWSNPIHADEWPDRAPRPAENFLWTAPTAVLHPRKGTSRSQCPKRAIWDSQCLRARHVQILSVNRCQAAARFCHNLLCDTRMFSYRRSCGYQTSRRRFPHRNARLPLSSPTYFSAIRWHWRLRSSKSYRHRA